MDLMGNLKDMLINYLVAYSRVEIRRLEEFMIRKLEKDIKFNGIIISDPDITQPPFDISANYKEQIYGSWKISFITVTFPGEGK